MSDRDPRERRTPFDATFTYSGQVFHVRFRTDMGKNPAFQDELSRVEEAERAGGEGYIRRVYSRLAVHVIAAWDLPGVDGHPLPITEDALDRLTVGALQRMVREATHHAQQLAPETSVPPPREAEGS